jgi:uncharacterized membrane protein YjdF
MQEHKNQAHILKTHKIFIVYNKLLSIMQPYLKKSQWIILLANFMVISYFTYVFIQLKNYEFLMYIAIIILIIAAIISTNKKINYPNGVLWGFTFCMLLHFAGGSMKFNGVLLYDLIIFPIAKILPILRYDQFVHIVASVFATLFIYSLIGSLLSKKRSNLGLSALFVLLLATVGTGAILELIEFTAVIILPSTGVGGYENTMLDIAANFIGSIFGLGLVIVKEHRDHNKTKLNMVAKE